MGTPSLMILDTCGTHVSGRRVLVVNKENTYRTFKGNIGSCGIQTYRNDGGIWDGEGCRSGGVEEGDEFRCCVGAIGLCDPAAVEGGPLNHAKIKTTECGSDMCAIWKERRRRVSVVFVHPLAKRKGSLDISAVLLCYGRVDRVVRRSYCITG